MVFALCLQANNLETGPRCKTPKRRSHHSLGTDLLLEHRAREHGPQKHQDCGNGSGSARLSESSGFRIRLGHESHWRGVESRLQAHRAGRGFDLSGGE